MLVVVLGIESRTCLVLYWYCNHKTADLNQSVRNYEIPKRRLREIAYTSISRECQHNVAIINKLLPETFKESVFILAAKFARCLVLFIATTKVHVIPFDSFEKETCTDVHGFFSVCLPFNNWVLIFQC